MAIMESPRINILLPLSTLLLLLVCLFSQLRVSNGKKDHAEMTSIKHVKSNAEIQALGKFAVDEINEATKRYFQFYWLPDVEDALLSFNEVYAARRRREGGGAIRYTLLIRAQSGNGRERKFVAYLRTVGDSKELLQTYYTQ